MSGFINGLKEMWKVRKEMKKVMDYNIKNQDKDIIPIIKKKEKFYDDMMSTIIDLQEQTNRMEELQKNIPPLDLTSNSTNRLFNQMQQLETKFQPHKIEEDIRSKINQSLVVPEVKLDTVNDVMNEKMSRLAEDKVLGPQFRILIERYKNRPGDATIIADLGRLIDELPDKPL